MKQTSKQARLLPNLEPIRDGNGLTIGDLTTRRTAESLLFGEPVLNTGSPAISGDKPHYRTLPEPMMTSPSPTRRRVQPIYCPRCSSWVEIRLQPVRLHCTGCGLEATP